MNRISRADLLETLAQLGDAFPEWRFGQLVANVATAAKGPQTEAVWDCEDDELIAAARRLIERNHERLPATAPEHGAASPAQPDAAA